MKGTFKAGFKYISSIFVVKEREIEIEIGGPTDVKHVAHIGWDGQTGSAPTWMNEFKAGPDFTAPSIKNPGPGLSPWSSQESMTMQSGSEFCNDGPQPTEVPPDVPKKQKRKKLKSNASSAARSTHATKSKAKLANNDTKSMKVEVATY